MPDILPEDSACMRWMEERSREIFRLFGFSEIRTPLLEDTRVFTRSIGQDTDIVEKEMYSFTDRGGKSVSLRPEGTASVIRAYIENLASGGTELVKLFYSGPMFRGERPQKGRLRQFHQIGVEIIGGKNPFIDAELIMCLDALLKNLGAGDFKIFINSIGCSGDRKAYTAKLKDYLSPLKEELCENCRRRVQSNVLRVLDCKRPRCRNTVKGAPAITDNLCKDCLDGYSTLKNILYASGIPFDEKPDLVRGLDYYTGTIFEVMHPGLGAQDAVAAGGRYDDLTADMGGPDTGATGFALGVERLMLIMDRSAVDLPSADAVVIPVDEALRADAFRLMVKFRRRGIACEMDHTGRSLKAQMRKANKEGRRFVALLGEDEARKGKVLIKDMSESAQRELAADEAIEFIKEALSVKDG
ncbi:MAG: histidine--tRNA ligase [Candidatus Omnitrophica bacterium]|nr:histidine--tRNA ligase [Candidatus Omnitrophota bacterium]